MSTHAQSPRPSHAFHARRGVPAARWAFLRLVNVWRPRLERHELLLSHLIVGTMGFVVGALFVYACLSYCLGWPVPVL